ncbi:MAG: hypothetical protein K8E66_07755, partial [Phycisphaerales bacterium]|nr:hypothetical protein [Phycisphaerales bacterium]
MIQDLFRHRHPFGAAVLAATVLACGVAQAADIDVRGVDAPRAAVAQALTTEAFAQMKIGESMTLRGLPVGDRRLDLELERFSVWTDDAEFFIDDRPSEKPGIVLLRGSVAGDESSRVVLGLGRHHTNGFIETRGETFSVSTGKRPGAADAGDIRIADLAGFKFEDAGHRCGIDDDNAQAYAPFGGPV